MKKSVNNMYSKECFYKNYKISIGMVNGEYTKKDITYFEITYYFKISSFNCNDTITSKSGYYNEFKALREAKKTIDDMLTGASKYKSLDYKQIEQNKKLLKINFINTLRNN